MEFCDDRKSAQKMAGKKGEKQRRRKNAKEKKQDKNLLSSLFLPCSKNNPLVSTEYYTIMQ